MFKFQDINCEIVHKVAALHQVLYAGTISFPHMGYHTQQVQLGKLVVDQFVRIVKLPN